MASNEMDYERNHIEELSIKESKNLPIHIKNYPYDLRERK